MVFIDKFTGHLRELYFTGNLMQFSSLRYFDFLSKEEILIVHQPISIHLQCTHSGGVNVHILELVSPKPKIFNLLSMPVLSTIVQKGGDCKSKVLPPCVFNIVGQNSRGTNNVFEYKQLLGFLKDK